MKRFVFLMFVALFIVSCGSVYVGQEADENQHGTSNVNQMQNIEAAGKDMISVFEWQDFVDQEISLEKLIAVGKHDVSRPTTIFVGDVEIKSQEIPLDSYDDPDDTLIYLLRSDVQKIGLLITLALNTDRVPGPIVLPEYNQIVFGQDGREYVQMRYGYPAIIRGFPLPPDVDEDDFIGKQYLPAFMVWQYMLLETEHLQFSTDKNCGLLNITTDSQVYRPATFIGDGSGFLSEGNRDYYTPLEKLRGFEAALYRFNCQAQVLEMIGFDQLTTNFIRFGPDERAVIFLPY